jgi:hypothetical protein
MQENEVLVSEVKSILLPIFGVIIFTMLFLIVYSQAIVAASWIWFTISMVLFMAVIFFLSSCFNTKYYFSDKNIIVADHRNEYIGEVECNSSVSWNEYIETQKGKKHNTIIIQNDERKIVIPEVNYKNYDEILGYFQKSKFRKDIDLDDSFPKKGIEGFYSNLDDIIGATVIYSGIFLLLLFWIIVSFKNDTGEKIYFSGKIEKIKSTYSTGKSTSRKYYTQLSNCPFTFRLSKSDDINFFFEKYDSYDNEKIYVNVDKKIKIGISKDDYEWKTKNKLIKFLDFSDGKTWDIEEYEMLEN